LENELIPREISQDFFAQKIYCKANTQNQRRPSWCRTKSQQDKLFLK